MPRDTSEVPRGTQRSWSRGVPAHASRRSCRRPLVPPTARCATMPQMACVEIATLPSHTWDLAGSSVHLSRVAESCGDYSPTVGNGKGHPPRMRRRVPLQHCPCPANSDLVGSGPRSLRIRCRSLGAR
jgi:hypothetical protein